MALADAEYKVVGEISLRAGPALTTPIFQTRDSNGIWLQEIGRAERIERFIPVTEDGWAQIGYVDCRSFRRVGQKAFYIFRDSASTLQVNTRKLLEPAIRADYSNLVGFPYLCRTLARFLDDDELFSSANAMVRRRRHYASQLRSRSLEKSYIERDVDRELVVSALEGNNIILTGFRGSGKTVCLHRLRERLEQAGTKVIYVPFSDRAPTSFSLVRAIAAQVGLSVDLPDASLSLSERLVSLNLSSIIAPLVGKVLIVDDADLAYSARETAETVIRLVGMGVQLVVALTGHQSEVFSDVFSGAKAQFKSFVLPPLSGPEVSLLLRNQLSHSRNDRLSIDELSSLISGLSFRQFITVLRNIRTDQFANDASAVFVAAFDDYLRRALWEAGFSSIPGRDGGAVEELLDAAANQGGEVIFEDDSKDDLQATFRILILSGILVKGPSGEPRFSHRLIEDWWLKQRSSSAKGLL